jgi:hypothetical protein
MTRADALEVGLQEVKSDLLLLQHALKGTELEKFCSASVRVANHYLLWESQREDK